MPENPVYLLCQIWKNRNDQVFEVSKMGTESSNALSAKTKTDGDKET